MDVSIYRTKGLAIQRFLAGPGKISFIKISGIETTGGQFEINIHADSFEENPEIEGVWIKDIETQDRLDAHREHVRNDSTEN